MKIMVCLLRARSVVTSFALVCLCFGAQSHNGVKKDNYYERCRSIAIEKDIPPDPGDRIISVAHRLFKNKFVHRLLTYNDVDSQFIQPGVLTKLNSESCPGYQEISSVGIMEMCPTYQVIESDTNRIPQLITQAKCRCLHCLGPWHDRSAKRCTPLFKFEYVFRVIEERNGNKRYALVREPLSFACACLRRSQRVRYVMSP